MRFFSKSRKGRNDQYPKMKILRNFQAENGDNLFLGLLIFWINQHIFNLLYILAAGKLSKSRTYQKTIFLGSNFPYSKVNISALRIS